MCPERPVSDHLEPIADRSNRSNGFLEVDGVVGEQLRPMILASTGLPRRTDRTAHRSGCPQLVARRRCGSYIMSPSRCWANTSRPSSSTSVVTRRSFGQYHVAPRSKSVVARGDRQQATADPASRLEHDHRAPCGMEQASSSETGGTSADDDDVGAGRLAHDASASDQAGSFEAAGSVIESIVSTGVASTRPSKVSEAIERPLRATTWSTVIVDVPSATRDLDPDGLCCVAGCSDSESACGGLAERSCRRRQRRLPSAAAPNSLYAAARQSGTSGLVMPASTKRASRSVAFTPTTSPTTSGAVRARELAGRGGGVSRGEAVDTEALGEAILDVGVAVARGFGPPVGEVGQGEQRSFGGGGVGLDVLGRRFGCRGVVDGRFGGLRRGFGGRLRGGVSGGGLRRGRVGTGASAESSLSEPQAATSRVAASAATSVRVGVRMRGSFWWGEPFAGCGSSRQSMV